LHERIELDVETRILPVFAAAAILVLIGGKAIDPAIEHPTCGLRIPVARITSQQASSYFVRVNQSRVLAECHFDMLRFSYLFP
jgi:hypothetical protein